jgi:hypothetical protein
VAALLSASRLLRRTRAGPVAIVEASSDEAPVSDT